MNTPTHSEITKQADKLWRNQGCPGDRDTEIWLEAERQLNEETTAESNVEKHPPSPEPEQKSIKAALKKKRARDPQVPRRTVPKSTPAEMGKPIWPLSHSS